MLVELMLSPQILKNDQWEFPIDPFLSKFNKVVKDRNRRYKVTILNDQTVMFSMEIKKKIEIKYKVKKNLWRVLDGYSEWEPYFQKALTFGEGTFLENGLKFTYSLIKNEEDLNFGLSYEQRNAFAEQSRHYIYGDEIK